MSRRNYHSIFSLDAYDNMVTASICHQLWCHGYTHIHIHTCLFCSSSDFGTCWTCCLLQVSSGGGGESQAVGPGVEPAVVGYPPTHHHFHHHHASTACLPLSACQPCHTHCTCWHTVGNHTLSANVLMEKKMGNKQWQNSSFGLVRYFILKTQGVSLPSQAASCICVCVWTCTCARTEGCTTSLRKLANPCNFSNYCMMLWDCRCNLRFICISKRLWASFCYLGVTLPTSTLLLVALQSYHAF